MRHTGQHPECERCSLYRQDTVFLEQVRSLVYTALMAQEEAEQYAEDIKDPLLWKKAQDELKKL